MTGSRTMSPRSRMLLGFLLANITIIVVAALLWYYRPLPPPRIQGVLLAESRTLDPFELTDHSGASFANEDLRGQWHLVSYGFTTCPDVCPSALSELASFVDRLEPAYREDLQVLFYSVDHGRDTPAQLDSYLSFFNQDFIGLTVTEPGRQDPAAFEHSLGILAQLLPAPGTELADGDYQVSHSVTLLLLNPQGELQAVLEPDRAGAGVPGFTVDTLLRDYTAVRNYLARRQRVNSGAGQDA